MFHSIAGSPLQTRILSASPFRHLIHGPSPLNVAHLEFLPRLSAAIQVSKYNYSLYIKHKLYTIGTFCSNLNLIICFIPILSDCTDRERGPKLENC